MTPPTARSRIILEARPGEITEKELAKEASGSGARYSFEIKTSGVTTTSGWMPAGKMLQNLKEGPRRHC